MSNKGAKERGSLLSEAIKVNAQCEEKIVETMTLAYVPIVMPESSLPPLFLGNLLESSSS